MVRADSVRATDSGFGTTTPARKPPRTVPPAKPRLQREALQSYLKKCTPIMLGWVMATTCSRFWEIPKERLPIHSMRGTIDPMRGPARYQGQGETNASSMEVNTESSI
jgi:hypothetical protein